MHRRLDHTDRLLNLENWFIDVSKLNDVTETGETEEVITSEIQQLNDDEYGSLVTVVTDSAA